MLVLLPLLASGLVRAGSDDIDELRATNDNEWHLVKNDAYHHIKTYSKLEDGKRIRSFKVDMLFDCTLETIARVSFDYDGYPRWYFKVKESKLLKRVSPTEAYYYQVFSAPPGLPDRDAVVHSTIEPYSAKRGYFRINLAAAPEYLPPQPNLVRILALNMAVTYYPVGEKKLHLESEGYIDPGGTAPIWATNYIQRNAPYAVMLGLQRITSSPEYVNSDKAIPFKYTE